MVKNVSLRRVMLAVLATVCAVCAAFTLATNGVKTASAAEFSYQEGRDGYGYTAEGLDVTFTVSDMESGLSSGLIKWVVYLIHENTGITYNASTHKYEDNNNRQRNVAAYYFLLNPSDAYDVNGNKVTANYTSTFKYIVASNAHAYHASSPNPSNANDFGTDTGKTLAEVFEEENWIVGVGPMFANWWASGYGAPIDYYVGRAADVSRATVTFRDYNPNTVISSLNMFTNVNVTVPEYTEITDEGYEFLGWYCDTTEKIYSKAEVEALTVKEVVDSKTRTVNFYAAYKKTFGEYIEFTADILGEDTESDGDDTKITRVVNATDNITETVTVVYDITHNDGANSLLLVPEYDKEVFTIQSVTVKDDTVLDAATIGEDGKYKILLEGKTLYDALDEGFLSITYLINEDKVVNGDYTFGLKVNPRVENASSVAYYWLEGTKTGEQEEIGIVVITPETLALSAIKQSTIRSSDYTFTYSNTVVTPAKVDNYTYYSYDNGDLKVYFDYDGDAEEFTYVWYASNGSTVIDAPKYVGEYYLDITAPATNFYLSSNTRVKVTIVCRDVTVNIANKSSVYLNDLAELTYQIVGTVYEGDMTVALETTATSTSPVGNYDITASVSGDYANQYNITINKGNYTITARAITIKAENQSAQYTGSEPTVSQTAYTVTGVDASYVSNVAIAKEAGVNAGTYTLTPSVNLGSNFTVELLEGTFTITSATTGANEIKQYFDGFDGDVEPYVLTYNGKYQLLVHAKEGTPEWVVSHIVASDAHYGRDAVEYNDVSVTLSFTADEAANFTNGEQSIVFTIDALINKAAITVSADAKTANYGDDAKDLTYTITSGTLYGKAADNDYHNASALSDDTLNVTLTTKDGGNAIIIDNTTPVGTYDIVIGATNANYNITLVDGTYTINKPVISDTDEDGNPDDASDDNLAHSGLKISLSATDVYYNRELVYSYKVMVGTQVLDGSAYTVKFYSDSACTDEVVPENFGTYYVKVAVADTDNYDGGSKVVSFEIMKIQLSAPSVSYSGAVVTLSAVTTDVGGKALKEGTTVSYVINSVDCTSSRSYTSTAAAVYSYVVGSDNDNYIVYEGTTEECYSITFTEGSHVHNPTELAVPATMYCFNTSSINLPEALSLDGYNFASWGGKSAESVYAPAASIVLDALWNAIEYTVTYKYTDGGAVAYEHIFYYGDAATYPTADVVPVKDSDNAGIYYTFADKWTANDTEYTFTTAEGIATITGVTVSSNMTFVAVFDTHYNSFTVKYYISSNGATSGYSAYGDDQEYTYLDVINYLSVSESVVWFKVDAWYLNENRTEAVPATMPNHDISVYGTYKFDIGAGDVNADGIVNADDITLYRQWIVGGYPMTIVENGNEWATAQTFDESTNYFLKRVADINVDGSKDVRDVSITRMSIVNGYNWDILTGENVTGSEIVRTYQSITVNEIASRLNSGKRVILGDNIEDVNGVIEVNFSGNVYIDLNGKTLTVESLALVSNGKDATITVKNGTIVTANGITIVAPNGNVVLENVIGYVGLSQVSLQAADSSLHFYKTVKFYKEQTETPVTVPVYVAENTHIVVEEKAELAVEKIIVATVTNNEFVAASEASITLDNKTSNEVVIDGKIENTITSLAELVNAMNNGGNYILGDDIAYNGSLYFQKDTSINLNGHTLESANSNAMFVGGGATLTVSGNGNVIAQEVCVLALDGSTAIINGGNYTSKDNFVVGTNGTSGRGENTITINGGTFNGGIQTANYIACGVYVANNDTVVINGGTFNVTNGVGVLARSGKTTVGENVVFNVTGNGTLGKVGDSNVTVPSGKILVVDYAAGYPGGEPVFTNNSEYDLCYILGDKTELLPEKVDRVINAAVMGSTIILVNDIDYSKVYTVRNARDNDNGHLVDLKDLTLDLNGHTIYSINATVVFGGNKATIKNGKFDLVEKNTDGSYKDGSYALIIDNAVTAYGETGTVLVKDVICDGGINVCSATVTLDNVTAHTTTTKFYAVWAEKNATLTINSGTYTDEQPSGKGVIASGKNSEGGVEICVKGGNFIGDNKLVYSAENGAIVITGGTFNINPAAYLAEGSIVCELGTTWVVASDLVKAVEVINNSANGGTIKLFADIDFSTETYAGYKWASNYNPLEILQNNVTLDLNGHTIYNMGNIAICLGYIKAADGSFSNITVKNGSLLAGTTDNVKNSYVLGIAGINGATIKNVTTDGGINVYTGSTNVVIEDSTINGTKYYAVCVQSGSDVTIKNSTVTKNTDSSVKTKAMFWIQNAGADEDMATSGNTTGAFCASSITLESGAYTVDTAHGGVFYLASGLKPVVSGGTFNINPADYLAEGYTVEENAGVYTVVAK